MRYTERRRAHTGSWEACEGKSPGPSRRLGGGITPELGSLWVNGVGGGWGVPGWGDLRWSQWTALLPSLMKKEHVGSCLVGLDPGEGRGNVSPPLPEMTSSSAFPGLFQASTESPVSQSPLGHPPSSLPLLPTH